MPALTEWRVPPANQPRASDYGFDLDRTLAIWETILADHPTDALALRLAHLKYFWLGRPRDMVASVERVVPRWGRDLPGWGAVLSCRCFAHEECGDYATAEAAGRAAVELDPADLWATHAVAPTLAAAGSGGSAGRGRSHRPREAGCW